MKIHVFVLVFFSYTLHTIAVTPDEEILIERLTASRSELDQVRSRLNSPIEKHKKCEKEVSEAYSQLLDHAFADKLYDRPNSFLSELIKKPDISKSVVLKICRTQFSKAAMSNGERGRLANYIIRTLYQSKASIPDFYKGIETVLLENDYPEVYTPETKEILKNGVLSAHLHFLFVDVAGIASNKEISSYLKQAEKQLQASESYNSFYQAWVVTCIQARAGDKVAYEKVKDAVKELRDLRRALYVPLGMAYIGDKEMVLLLFNMLKSDLKKWNGEDAMPQETQLAHEAAIALSLCVKDFPKYENFHNFTAEDKVKCLKWVKEHQESFVIENKSPLYYVKNTRLNLLLHR